MSTRSTIDAVSAAEYVPTADQRIVMYGLSWDDFETFVAMRGMDAQRPRVTFFEGALELMSPSTEHEKRSRRLHEIIIAYLDQLGLTYEGTGAWLVKRGARKAGLEPDESYVIGDIDKDRPDLAIEVVWTSGGINKLDVYERLGVPEVWFWHDDGVRFYVLTESGYELRATSLHIPTFDRTFAAEMMALEPLSAVRRALRERLG